MHRSASTHHPLRICFAISLVDPQTGAPAAEPSASPGPYLLITTYSTCSRRDDGGFVVRVRLNDDTCCFADLISRDAGLPHRLPALEMIMSSCGRYCDVMRRVFACVADVHGITAGCQVWSIRESIVVDGQEPRLMESVEVIQYSISRDYVAVYECGPPSLDEHHHDDVRDTRGGAKHRALNRLVAAHIRGALRVAFMTRGEPLRQEIAELDQQIGAMEAELHLNPPGTRRQVLLRCLDLLNAQRAEVAELRKYTTKQVRASQVPIPPLVEVANPQIGPVAHPQLVLLQQLARELIAGNTVATENVTMTWASVAGGAALPTNARVCTRTAVSFRDPVIAIRVNPCRAPAGEHDQPRQRRHREDGL